MKKGLAVLLVMLVIVGTMGFFPGSATEMVFADGYNGSTYEGAGVETITFSSKNDEEIFIDGGLPKYYDTSAELKNTCANVAGAITLGYFDKDYDELIPNFKAARVIRDKVLFSTQTAAIQDVIIDLYQKMNTNSLGNGTSVEQFKNGLTQYVKEHGRNISYNQLVKNEQIDFDAYKRSVEEKKPIVLFVSKYTMLSITDFEKDSNTDELVMQYYGGDHVLIGYGIREISYFNADGSLKEQITFLRVATGYAQDALAYIRLDDRIRVIDGYTINIQ